MVCTINRNLLNALNFCPFLEIVILYSSPLFMVLDTFQKNMLSSRAYGTMDVYCGYLTGTVTV
jgi:hypothetical protein